MAVVLFSQGRKAWKATSAAITPGNLSSSQGITVSCPGTGHILLVVSLDSILESLVVHKKCVDSKAPSVPTHDLSSLATFVCIVAYLCLWKASSSVFTSDTSPWLWLKCLKCAHSRNCSSVDRNRTSHTCANLKLGHYRASLVYRPLWSIPDWVSINSS